jgi:hypothetical protein
MPTKQQLKQAKRDWTTRRARHIHDIKRVRKLRRSALTAVDKKLFKSYLSNLTRMAIMCGKMARSVQRAIDNT